ncbi:MAG: hypothetical protein RR397_08990 [Odoribacter sp.]
MRAKDWKSVKTAKVLLIGEDSNLQWSDDVPEFVMFANYYFREFPTDHGERSRHVEAQNLFAHLREVTAGKFKPDEVYVTNLCREPLPHAPKGKRVLIPEERAQEGLEHIQWILIANPSIEWIVPMSLQVNYWLQKLDFYTTDPSFLTAAEPRRTGMNNGEPYYQPVDGKAFSQICGSMYEAKEQTAKVVPILPAKDFPLRERNLEVFGEAYKKLKTYFSSL